MTLPPYVYHLAEEANWPSIQKFGLSCAASLVDRSGATAVERESLLKRQRRRHTVLADGNHLRDQLPMPANALIACLVGTTPDGWYELMNSKVFFWLDPARLDRQRRACEPRPQVVLVVDTQRLVARYAKRIALSPINTGNARRKAALRGPSTFVPYDVWLDSAWSSEAAGLATRTRPRSHRPVELTVVEAVPDIMDIVVRVWAPEPGESFRRPRK